MKPRVLIVDDEETIRKLLKSRLDREGSDTLVASNAEEAKSLLGSGQEFGVMITDLKMPGEDGFKLMSWARERFKNLRVIVITGHGEKAAAIQAIRQGAADYMEKPFDLDELTHTVKRCMREHQLESENRDLVGRLEARIERVEGKTEDQSWYVSKSQSMAKVNEWLQVLRREAMRGEAEEPTVLIMGESGTGKEGIARMVHAGSRRGKGPWVAVNCANFSEQLLESELFGHEKGAFTGANSMKRGLFEIARGGTLFLDELGEMDVKLQAKLLRVLQEKAFRRVGGTVDIESDVRVIAATNVDLVSRCTKGTFREDLYHRLSRVVVELPALRARVEDLLPMAKEFSDRAFRSRGKTFAGFTTDAEHAIENYPWPGNVRELLNVVERMALVASGHGAISGKDLGLPRVPTGTAARTPLTTVDSSVPMGEQGYMVLKKQWCNAFEKEYLTELLRKYSGNVSAASRDAKLDRSNFLRLLRRHALKAQEFRRAGEPAGVEVEQEVA